MEQFAMIVSELSKAQRRWLEQARINSDREEYLSLGVRARSGGSIRRVLEGLEQRGLLDGPPWYITPAGRAALARTAAQGKGDGT